MTTRLRHERSFHEVVVTYTDGAADTRKENDLFFWPPGHSVRVVTDSEVVDTHALDHMLDAMKG